MTVKSLRFIAAAALSTLSINSALALPIDWNGVFGVDTHLINNTCRTSDVVTPESPAARSGSQGIGGDCNTSFQTYVFKLNPHIIVNDGVSLKGELSSGYLRGGFAGSEATNVEDGVSGSNSYFFATPAQRSALNVNQMYMELYADTALVKIGRMSKHYGTGAIFDNGSEAWDRFFTMYDGIEAEMKIGNFSLIPSWAKISSHRDEDTTNATPAAGEYDVRETGVVAKYDNKNRDLVVSVLYAKRFSEPKNSLYNGTSATNGGFNRGRTEVTIIDPYISKKWNRFKLSAEAPMMSGEYGNVYGDGSKSKISANSYLVEAKYELNPKWEMGVNLGQVSGDDGSTGKFEGTYLHPNFHIADLMFRYNAPGFNEGGRSIFDSSIANAQFLKLYGNYKSDKWTWKGAFIFAKAMETARAGEDAYNHERNYRFASTQEQQDDLGYEVDFGFDYRWNPNVIISGYYGYWFVGDYYAFSNTADELAVANVHGGGLRATLEF